MSRQLVKIEMCYGGRSVRGGEKKTNRGRRCEYVGRARVTTFAEKRGSGERSIEHVEVRRCHACNEVTHLELPRFWNTSRS